MHINANSIRPLPLIAFITIALLVGWVSAIASNRTMPVGPAKIIIEEPNRIFPGGYLLIDVIVPYYQSCTAIVKRALYDSNNVRHVLPEIRLPPSEIGTQHSASRFPIPQGFALGTAEYRSQASYGCNWFQRWIWPVESTERRADFIVTAPSAADIPPNNPDTEN